jgi:hypothetical protein
MVWYTFTMNEKIPASTNPDIVQYEKKYESRFETRSKTEGKVEADKRREYLPVIEQKVSELLHELGIQKFIIHTTGSVDSNLCNKFSDIDLELLIPKTSETINTIAFTDRLNKELAIPYSVHMFPIYVGASYFE